MSLHAGAARVAITPATPCHLAGYAARNKPWAAVHDPLYVRALYLRDAAGGEIAIVVADMLWWGGNADMAEAALAGRLGIPAARIWLGATHTHSAPMPDGTKSDFDWREGLLVAATSAALRARERAATQPARLKIGRGASRIGVNRRERRDGKIVLGANPAGPCDREIIGIAVDGADGTPIARVANFGCHGVVMGQESLAVSGDWPGEAAGRIEEHLAGAPFLLLQGGSGNVNPRIGPQNDFAPVAALAAEFVGNWGEVERSFEPVDGPAAVVGGVQVPLSLPHRKGGERDLELRVLRVGPAAVVGVPCEVFSETTLAAKAESPRPLMVASYAGPGDAGYLPVAEAYPEGGYEVESTPYTPVAESILRQVIRNIARS